jgi:hypothetical protein
MISLKDKVLEVVRARGPVLPVHINKETGRDSFFSGAILSELIENKLVKISNGKIGGSPVYYVAGQEPKLSILYDHLPMREKEAYTLLKEKQVLWDGDLNPGIRVALRMIKDFAFPLKLQRGNREEIAWYWYLLNQQEAMNLLQSKQQENVVQPQQQMQQSIPKQEPEIKIQQPAQIEIPFRTKISELPVQQQILEEKPQKKHVQKIDFMHQMITYFNANNLNVLEEHMIRKNREYDCSILLPSNIGAIEYLVIAKNKKTINEGDLSLAYQKGQSKKLPVILLTNGELTKKAREYREKNLKGYVIVKRL